jgi:hypothetical protein
MDALALHQQVIENLPGLPAVKYRKGCTSSGTIPDLKGGHRMKNLVLSGFLCLIMFCSGLSFAGGELKEQSRLLAVQLKDGSHLVGTSDLESLPARTQWGARVDVRLKDLQSIEFKTDRETARISFQNGDTLTGVFDVAALEVNTLLGKASIPVGEIAGIQPAPLALADRPAAGSALRYNGNDKVYIADAPAFELQDLTLQALVKIQAAGPVGSPSRVILFRGDTRMDNDPYYLALTDEGHLYTGIDQESGEKFYAENEKEAPLNEWLHVSASYDSRQRMLRLYVNGDLCAETATTGDPVKVLTGPDPGLSIGNFQSRVWPNMFAGVIDEVRIWNTALTQEQIRQNMRIKLTGKEPGLVAYWDFEEGEGQVAHDRTGGGHDGCLGATPAADPDDPSWAKSDAPVEYPREEKPTTAAEQAARLKKIEQQLARDLGPEVTMVVDLVDGSRIVGKSTLGVVPILTEWAGKLEVALKSFSSIELEEDREKVKVTLQNGDLVRGALELPGIILETSFGKVVIPIEHVQRVTSATGASPHLREGLIGHYPFQGNTNDESGSANHGEAHGATLTRNRFGNPDSAYELDGTDDYIDISAIADDISRTENTVSLWFTPAMNLMDFDETTSAQVLFSNWHRNRIGYEDGNLAGTLKLATDWDRQVTESALELTCAVGLEAQVWYHVALTFSSNGKAGLYLNGAKVAEQAPTAGLGIAYFGEVFSLGRTLDNQGARHYFKGAIDDVRIYNRALSENEVRKLYRIESMRK